MMRVMAGVAAWAAGTVIAVGVTWFGANVVIRNAGVGPGMPVVNAALLTPSAAPSLSPAPPFTVAPATTGASGRGGGTPAARRTSASPGASDVPPAATASAPASSPASPSLSASPPRSQSQSPTPSPSPSPSPSVSGSVSAGIVRAYTLTGGRVTLEVTPTSVQLVTAVPDAGYSVQTWSETGWLRVDFSSGSQVSYLIATWYEHAPTITVTN